MHRFAHRQNACDECLSVLKEEIRLLKEENMSLQSEISMWKAKYEREVERMVKL